MKNFGVDEFEPMNIFFNNFKNNYAFIKLKKMIVIVNVGYINEQYINVVNKI